MTEKTCTVCGYEMEDGPRDWNICPSCGTEFNLHDVNSSIKQLQEWWISTGPEWWSEYNPKPDGWDPLIQLRRIGVESD